MSFPTWPATSEWWCVTRILCIPADDLVRYHRDRMLCFVVGKREFLTCWAMLSRNGAIFQGPTGGRSRRRVDSAWPATALTEGKFEQYCPRPASPALTTRQTSTSRSSPCE